MTARGDNPNHHNQVCRFHLKKTVSICPATVAVTLIHRMEPYIRAKNLYLQGAPSKLVVAELKKCSDWKEESFQDRVVKEVPTVFLRVSHSGSTTPSYRRMEEITSMRPLWLGGSLTS